MFRKILAIIHKFFYFFFLPFFALGFSVLQSNGHADAPPANSGEYWVAYTCGLDICVQSEAGAIVNITKSSGEENSHPVWSPDASKIYFAKQSTKEEVMNNPNVSPSQFKEKNSDIYVRELAKPEEKVFYGKPLNASAFTGAGGLIGTEVPLGFSKKGNYFIFGDSFNFLMGTTTSNGQTIVSYARVDIPFYIDTALSQEPKKGYCQVDPGLMGDIIKGEDFNFSPNEEWVGGLSSYQLKHPAASANAPLVITSESGITSCSVSSSAAKRVFDQTMDKKSLVDTAVDANGGLAFNDDGTLYHLPNNIRSTIETIIQKPLIEMGDRGFERFYLSPDREGFAFVHEDKIYMLSPKQNISYYYPSAVSKLLAWSEDGKRLMALGSNQKVIVLDPWSGATHELSVLPEAVSAIRISPLPLGFQVVQAGANAASNPGTSNAPPASCSLRK